MSEPIRKRTYMSQLMRRRTNYMQGVELCGYTQSRAHRNMNTTDNDLGANELEQMIDHWD